METPRRSRPWFVASWTVGVATALCLLSSGPVAVAATAGARPQRYPRAANDDGSFRCYPDGCSSFGLCCSA